MEHSIWKPNIFTCFESDHSQNLKQNYSPRWMMQPIIIVMNWNDPPSKKKKNETTKKSCNILHTSQNENEFNCNRKLLLNCYFLVAISKEFLEYENTCAGNDRIEYRHGHCEFEQFVVCLHRTNKSLQVFTIHSYNHIKQIYKQKSSLTLNTKNNYLQVSN